jgi:hypothetical protein
MIDNKTGNHYTATEVLKDRFEYLAEHDCKVESGIFKDIVARASMIAEQTNKTKPTSTPGLNKDLSL